MHLCKSGESGLAKNCIIFYRGRDLLISDIFQIQKKMMGWYGINKRNLPWRQTRDPYRIWISEVMLQQTQVKTVIPYYLDFIDTFPTVDALAAASLDSVLKKWEGLGYYARARNLHKASIRVTRDFEKRIPDNFDVFKTLPGVGDYIASAVMSIAFGHSHAVVDGNVKRVLSRLAMIPDPVNLSKSHAVFKDLATRLLGPSDPEIFNQAIMELGALICLPQNPLCRDCPVLDHCLAFSEKETHLFPKRQEKAPVPTRNVAVGVVSKSGKVLITRRKTEGLLGGLWEFPGGKVNDHENASDACIREILEETGLKVSVDSHLTHVKHAYTHFKIEMEVFCCSHISGEITLNGPIDYAWIPLDEIDRYAFPKANLKFIPLLRKT